MRYAQLVMGPAGSGKVKRPVSLYPSSHLPPPPPPHPHPHPHPILSVAQSTFCRYIQQHCANTKRTVHIVNLDPAAENFEYRPSIGNCYRCWCC